jgi:hypothetical protein
MDMVTALAAFSCTLLVTGIVAFSLGTIAWIAYNRKIDVGLKKLLFQNRLWLEPDHQKEIDDWWKEFKAKTSGRFAWALVALIASLICAIYANRFF